MRSLINLVEAAPPLRHSPDEVAAVIEQELGKTGFSAEECNDGYCGHLADHVVRALGGGEVLTSDDLFPDWPRHEWVHYGGRHYDAETPFGVDDPRDLRYFRRHLRGS